MTLTRDRLEILEILLARVSRSTAITYFHADEVRQWEPGALAELLKSGLLKPASDTDWLECRRCTRRCPRPVEQLSVASSGKLTRLATTCDLRDDVTIVPVQRWRLKRWKTTRPMVAQFVGQQLGIRIRDTDYEARRVSFRACRLGAVRLSGSLEFDDKRIAFRSGDDRINLDELVLWNVGQPCLDTVSLTAWAARALAVNAQADGSHPPSRLRQKLRKANTEGRNSRWQERAEFLKSQNPKRKKSDIAAEIYRSKKWPGVNSSATIERILRLPR